MNLQFKKVQFYNFCSYHEAEVILKDRGFCFVSGINKCKKDSSLSNGAGKSTVLSAISFALTGETIGGLKNYLKNRYIDENSSYVTLDFSVDADSYQITRYIAPKSDLKIIKNGEDISGKGIRESEKILSDNLPDLTKDLIASTIIIGQGMPSKLTSFQPSGRKELLERLTKSDFMIEDIKNRLASRLDNLNIELRKIEDSLLVDNTKLATEKTLLTKTETDFNSMTIKDFDTLIPAAEKSLAEIKSNLEKVQQSDVAINETVEKINTEIFSLTADKAKENDEEYKAYAEAYNEKKAEKMSIQSSVDFLNKEITRLKAIKDVCPTCGQKLPGVLKPDTSEQEEKIRTLLATEKEIDIKLDEISKTHQAYLDEINNKYAKITTLQSDLKINKDALAVVKSNENSLNTLIVEETNKLNKLLYDKENDERIRKALENKINESNSLIHLLENNIKIVELSKLNVLDRININKKIDGLVRREFRGFLLYNIIEYLNKTAKEYSNIVFNTDELEVYLDGNALDISYCGKIYESLSGGEKQRVDLILQFAIRDLLQTYFNYSSNILALDEITDNLDRVATNKIFDLITSKLHDVESVFIISHHDDELEIPIDSELQIIKDENGISNIKEN